MSAPIRELQSGPGTERLRVLNPRTGPTPHTSHTNCASYQLNGDETADETTVGAMPRRRNSAPTWLVTIRAGAEVVSTCPCPDVRHAVLLAGVVRRFWPDLRVAVRRYPQAARRRDSSAGHVVLRVPQAAASATPARRTTGGSALRGEL
jgi:hypothetical protein